MGHLWRTFLAVLSAGALLAAVSVTGSASFASAASGFTCSGTPASPGTLAGTHSSVQVTGVCQVNGGQAVVTGNVTVLPGATLLAVFANNDLTGAGSSGLTVDGNVTVQNGATLFLGCEAPNFACFDDPNQNNPTLNSAAWVGGNLTSTNPLGVVVHKATIGRSVTQVGGGGGFNCNPAGAFGFAVFSAYEDSSVGGSLTISGLASCWLGVARAHIGGNLSFGRNSLADPDAIEIISNQVTGTLSCVGNSTVWDSVESPNGLFPRIPLPNTVGGHRGGQCVLSTPTTVGGPSGPGPF